MFAEDLTVFFEDFGIEVEFSRGGSPLLTATMILDAPPSEVSVYDRSFYDEKFYEARVRGQNVSLLGIASEVANVQLNDVATLASGDWYVLGIEPDGTGLMTVHLSIHQG